MMKYGLSCSLEAQSPRQPTILRGDIGQVARDAASLGYDGIELFIRDARQYDAAALKAAADQCGMAYCAIATGMEYTRNGLSLISDETSVRDRAIECLKEHLDLGAQLGCPVVVGIMRANIPDFDRYDAYEERFTQALAALSDYAKQAGASIVVESITRYICNYLNTATETARYLRRLNRDNVRLHIDTHSMAIEDADLPAAVWETSDVLGYVHFSDSNRCYPGAGNVDFKGVMKALVGCGYGGYVTAECLPYPSSLECARRSIVYMKALYEAAQIERAQIL